MIQQLQGEFVQADKDLFTLAAEYHERTEAYDRTVCTGPIVRGGIMPATAYERVAINRHAAIVRAELLACALRLGYTNEQFQKAIASHRR